jgi:hypothetical protein
MLNLFNRNIKENSYDNEKQTFKEANKKSTSFFTSYFDTYELIKSEINLFTPKKFDDKSQYFGAFINK